MAVFNFDSRPGKSSKSPFLYLYKTYKQVDDPFMCLYKVLHESVGIPIYFLPYVAC